VYTAMVSGVLEGDTVQLGGRRGSSAQNTTSLVLPTAGVARSRMSERLSEHSDPPSKSCAPLRRSLTNNRAGEMRFEEDEGTHAEVH
jgi:hypothetical protein